MSGVHSASGDLLNPKLASDLDGKETSEDHKESFELGTILFEAYKMHTEVNNDGNICLFLIEKKQHSIKKYFLNILTQEKPSIAMRAGDQKKRLFIIVKKP